jgi:SAM-dependent methyltransferase
MTSRPYFDAVASDWDAMRQGFFSERVREAALDALRVVPGRRAADVGAGTGFMTEALLERGLDVVAIDESPRMLAVLRERLGEESIECRLSDGRSLPLETGSVDYGVANMYSITCSRPRTRSASWYAACVLAARSRSPTSTHTSSSSFAKSTTIVASASIRTTCSAGSSRPVPRMRRSARRTLRATPPRQPVTRGPR